MNTEEQRQRELGKNPTDKELLNYLSKQLDTYEDEYIKPFPKELNCYL